MLVFFFFKQKTAYEMRISDWSSDVCSSDLDAGEQGHEDACERDRAGHRRAGIGPVAGDRPCGGVDDGERHACSRRDDPGRWPPDRLGDARSEEHTSELQSLMRISYAVFCLKKTNSHVKKKITDNQIKNMNEQ